MVQEIPLTKGQVALVDDEEYEWLSRWKWSYERYATRTCQENGKQRQERMHRVILNPAPGIEVDHINGNKLDNRRANLRPATHGQNKENQATVGRNSRTGIRNVQIDIGAGGRPRYRVKLKVQQRHIHIGRFASLEAAQAAAVEARKAYMTHTPDPRES